MSSATRRSVAELISEGLITAQFPVRDINTGKSANTETLGHQCDIQLYTQTLIRRRPVERCCHVCGVKSESQNASYVCSMKLFKPFRCPNQIMEICGSFL
ncbi:hypothetical protein ILYODFUR_033901 [Ilyodon furcidens]|uniref:Uncharacterized protein n=1 Tax=Ilyodon furcidens TaxID=33524 RepID=A0ABV0SS68_9TELE